MRVLCSISKQVASADVSSLADYETDAVIQSSLRTELKSDVTVITVAHRLQTIMDYDKIVSPNADHALAGVTDGPW